MQQKNFEQKINLKNTVEDSNSKLFINYYFSLHSQKLHRIHIKKMKMKLQSMEDTYYI